MDKDETEWMDTDSYTLDTMAELEQYKNLSERD